MKQHSKAIKKADIILYTILILRIIFRAEKQTQPFPRIFSYSFASMLFVHFFINIGMTLGLVPTVGIPYPLLVMVGQTYWHLVLCYSFI